MGLTLDFSASVVLAERVMATVLLTHPAEVTHRLHHNDVGKELSPLTCESGICYCSNQSCCCHMGAEVPNCFLCCA